MAEPAAPAAAPPQKFADAEPGYAFADPERKTKLVAAFPAIDAALEAELKKHDLHGFAVGIVIDGELAYAKGFGTTDLEKPNKPDADTVYRIGSISKSVTGLALLALRDDGVLGLDDTLVKWIPEAAGLVYPAHDARPITLRQLLSHTSGLPRMGPFPPENGPTEDVVVKSLTGLPLERVPDQEHVYSNLGFSLLGIVVGHAAKSSLHDVVDKRVFAPLGMTSTHWERDALPAGKLATSYIPAPDGKLVPRDPARLGAADGAGGIYSTVRDMARYAAFQLSAYPPRNEPERGPVRRATIREAHATGVAAIAHVTPPRATAKRGGPLVDMRVGTYGFGWVHGHTCLHEFVTHNGAIDSYRADLRLYPAYGIGLVMMNNYANDNFSLDRVFEELEKTGALVERVKPSRKPEPAFEPAMKDFLDVYNQWDEGKYKAMLDPDRPPVVQLEKDELAGYKALHGACKSYSFVEAPFPGAARFKLACERGELELEVGLSPRGKIGGFGGKSRNVTAPPAIAKQAAAIVGLVAKWDDATYKRVLGKTKAQTALADAKDSFGGLRIVHGACKLEAAGHDVIEWTFDVACERSGFTLRFAPHKTDPAAVETYGMQINSVGRCPAR